MVFVYGTLQEGFGGNSRLDGSVKLGAGRTRDEAFSMWCYTSGSFPMAFDWTEEQGGEPCSIRGELWLMDSWARLYNCDSLEGHPRWYCRRKVQVVLDGHETPREAWMYIMRPGEHEGVRIEDGNWSQHIQEWWQENFTKKDIDR